LNKITELKSAPNGVNQKKKFKGGILKKFFADVKQNSPTLQEVKTYLLFYGI
jgi:hypothetical protein